MSDQHVELNADLVPEQFREQAESLDDLFAPEPLDPELQDFVVDQGDGWVHLKHPLVVWPFWTPVFAKQANTALRYKREALAAAQQAGDWNAFVFLHERPWRPEAFTAIRHRLDGDAYWSLLEAVWTDTESLHEWQGLMTKLLHSGPPPGPAAMMDDDDRAVYDALPDEVTIYRGYCVDGAEHGWSWTLDRERAKWFAQRFTALHGSRPRVATGRVAKADVLAVLTGRHEDEVVVDPYDVRIVTRRAAPRKDGR